MNGLTLSSWAVIAVAFFCGASAGISFATGSRGRGEDAPASGCGCGLDKDSPIAGDDPPYQLLVDKRKRADRPPTLFAQQVRELGADDHSQNWTAKRITGSSTIGDPQRLGLN
jgi:hypothetical protein